MTLSPDILCKYCSFTVALFLKSVLYGERKSMARSLKARNLCCCGGKQYETPGENNIPLQHRSLKQKKQSKSYRKLFCKPFSDLSRASNLSLRQQLASLTLMPELCSKFSASQCIWIYPAALSIIQRQLFDLIWGHHIKLIPPVIKK